MRTIKMTEVRSLKTSIILMQSSLFKRRIQIMCEMPNENDNKITI